ncbi:DEAD/DEAH box helicase [Mesobacillus campisalis]|uniref:RNA helicase n=1 Tax=Mesobacillus campisalis TaxID=1408103 RepID=A0A0M2SUQ0_9BACI|nr:DEAD/DEAH box helicase [Mesobacillus campisalis]KKK37863.1 DEAD/DEAH box helicase [Mesobacillus campisalis]
MKAGIGLRDFKSLGISEALAGKLREEGIVQSTPIQEKAIPFVMDGKDVIAQAQTGTGKTFAFVLPILEKIDRGSPHIQALIVTPTRELALQITGEVEKLIADMEDVHVLAVYGGQDVAKQLNKLKNKNVQIVVGTPGRLLDHIRRESVDLSHASFLVLDEADQMLHIGFLHEVEQIIHETPGSRQTMLFSATMPAEIRKLARTHMKDPQYIQVEKTQGPAETVKQIAIHTVDRAKQGTLVQLIETHRPFLAVIFCRTKRRVSKLYDALKVNGMLVDELHGDLSQAKREQVMKKFREAEIQLLVATDVAARGLDIEGVTHVFNYDIPLDSESYVHRIGRTGRAGTKGLAITLYSSKDRPLLDQIEKDLDIRIEKKNIGNMEGKEDQKTSSGKKPAKQRERRPGSTSTVSGKQSNDKRRGKARQERVSLNGPVQPKREEKEATTRNRGNDRTDNTKAKRNTAKRKPGPSKTAGAKPKRGRR